MTVQDCPQSPMDDILIPLRIPGDKFFANTGQLPVVLEIMQPTTPQLFHHAGKHMLDEQIIQLHEQFT